MLDLNSSQMLVSNASSWDKLENVFPSWKGQKIVGLDIETYDPNLHDMGNGAFRGDGHICGIAIAFEHDFKAYYPIAHQDGPNYETSIVRDYLRDELSKFDGFVVGANLLYEMDWLTSLGIDLYKNKCRDIQIAEPLIDEERVGGYSLENLAQHYLGVGKSIEHLWNAGDIYGVDYGRAKSERSKKDILFKHLHTFHWRHVGPYGADDAQLAVQVIKKQIPLIRRDNLEEIFLLEHELLPVLHLMRRQGVRVDVNKAEELNEQYNLEYKQLTEKLNKTAGMEVDEWSPTDLEALFLANNWEYPKTEAGNPSFEKSFLEKQGTDIANMILRKRSVRKMNDDFIKKICLEMSYNGRVYPTIWQLAADEYGTRSGRFSYSSPNLQQIPKKGEWKSVIRQLFIPEDGELWGHLDYSQQEPRLAVHFAIKSKARGWQKAAAYYQDPDADYHQFAADMAGITRNQAKPFNLGSFYGMGKAKICAQLGVDMELADELYKRYHKAMPFVKDLSKSAMNKATRLGYIDTLMGRRSRFKKLTPQLTWDQKTAQKGKGYRFKLQLRENIEAHIEELRAEYEADPSDINGEALAYWEYAWQNNEFERAFTYKAFNRKIQGSAADQTKKAMVDVYKHFGHVNYLRIQVHDELNGSYPNLEDIKIVQDIMQNTIPLKVPVKVDAEYGPNWASTQAI